MKKIRCHILVVDDDDRIRELVKEYLNENGFIISTANSAEEAKIKLTYFKFDLLVLDVMMPGQNGFELTSLAFGIQLNLKNLTIDLASRNLISAGFVNGVTLSKKF